MVQYSTVQYSTVQYSTVQGTVPSVKNYLAVQFIEKVTRNIHTYIYKYINTYIRM